MNTRQNYIAAQLLRWTVGLVVLWESYQFAFSAGARHHLQQMGLPQWVAPALGGAEIVAAILFLFPKLDRIGGYSLLVIFAVAAAFHVLHGQFEIGPLFVYGASVWACISARERIAPESAS
ncbi:MAG TPA: DoxX family protein [Candidatus Acidoferrum sp.]|nr:DoxX family protein [Candidatus Acidoferrum sp.]